MEEAVFLGHCVFWSYLNRLNHASTPLIQLDRDSVFLTNAGRQVLEGREDFIHLNGIDRWLGGVHLAGRQAAFRWDESARRLQRL
jgi:hypothetical protein